MGLIGGIIGCKTWFDMGITTVSQINYGCVRSSCCVLCYICTFILYRSFPNNHIEACEWGSKHLIIVLLVNQLSSIVEVQGLNLALSSYTQCFHTCVFKKHHDNECQTYI